MGVTRFVLDSAHIDYAPVLAALQTVTAAKKSHTPTQSIRSASHNSALKIVKAKITDAERTGALAPLHRDNYGVGVFKDEYPTNAAKDREAFSLLGKSGYVNVHFEAPYSPDGSWVWSKKSTFGSGDGRTYGDRIVGAPTVNGEFGAVYTPLTAKEEFFFHGFFIHVDGLDATGTVEGRSRFKVFNGVDANNKFKYSFDHWLKPGAISQGTVIQNANSWTKDGGSNAYSIPSTTHNSDSRTSSKFVDPDFDTFELGEELAPAADLADLKATPGTFFYDAAGPSWWVHLEDGSDPTGRVVGAGDFGYRISFNSQIAAETIRQYVEFNGLTMRCANIDLAPDSATVNVFEHIDFHMLNMKYTSGGNGGRLFSFGAQGKGIGSEIRDILINVDQISRGKNAIYIISQSGIQVPAKMHRITVQADPNARDGRENVFDIGGFVPHENDNDGHVVGFQLCDNLTIQFLKSRRCGGHIIGYARNHLDPAVNFTTRPFNNILIANNDVAEHATHYGSIGSTSASVGIGFHADNAHMWLGDGCIVRDNNVLGYDTESSKAFAFCYRNIWPD